MALDDRKFPPGWFGDGYEYVFSIEVPVNQDAYWLKVIRWRGEPNTDDFEQQYLSQDGWVDYNERDMMRDPIIMTGLRHHQERQIKQMVLDAMIFAMTTEPSTN